MAKQRVPPLEWSKRARVCRSDIGTRRIWSARTGSPDLSYSVQELESNYGLPTIYLSYTHIRRYDPILKADVTRVEPLRQRRTLEAVKRDCQKHYRSQS